MDVSEDLVRVPLVFSMLGDGKDEQNRQDEKDAQASLSLPTGKRISQLARQIDALPTALDLVGIPVPSQIHAQSLKPALLDDTQLGLEAYVEAFLRIRSDQRDQRVGWRTSEWKYVYAPLNPHLPAELYHLPDDPSEQRNLATQHPKVAQLLQRRIEDLQHGALAATPGLIMTEAEKAEVERRLTELGYM